MFLYTVKIAYSYWFNYLLIGQPPGRQGKQTKRILVRVKAETQRKQYENVSLRKGTKPHG